MTMATDKVMWARVEGGLRMSPLHRELQLTREWGEQEKLSSPGKTYQSANEHWSYWTNRTGGAALCLPLSSVSKTCRVLRSYLQMAFSSSWWKAHIPLMQQLLWSSRQGWENFKATGSSMQSAKKRRDVINSSVCPAFTIHIQCMCKEAFYFKNILGSLSFETLIFLGEGFCTNGWVHISTHAVN